MLVQTHPLPEGLIERGILYAGLLCKRREENGMLIKFPATNTRIRPTARLRATGIAIGPAVTFGPIGITAPKSATSIVAPETRRSDTRRPRAVFLRAGIVALALGIVALALMGANWARAGSSY